MKCGCNSICIIILRLHIFSFLISFSHRKYWRREPSIPATTWVLHQVPNPHPPRRNPLVQLIQGLVWKTRPLQVEITWWITVIEDPLEITIIIIATTIKTTTTVTPRVDRTRHLSSRRNHGLTWVRLPHHLLLICPSSVLLVSSTLLQHLHTTPMPTLAPISHALLQTWVPRNSSGTAVTSLVMTGTNGLATELWHGCKIDILSAGGTWGFWENGCWNELTYWLSEHILYRYYHVIDIAL